MSREGGFESGGEPTIGKDFHPENGDAAQNPTEASNSWLARNKEAIARTVIKASSAVSAGMTTFFSTNEIPSTSTLVTGLRIVSAAAAATGAWIGAREMLKHGEEDDADIDKEDNAR